MAYRLFKQDFIHRFSVSDSQISCIFPQFSVDMTVLEYIGYRCSSGVKKLVGKQRSSGLILKTTKDVPEECAFYSLKSVLTELLPTQGTEEVSQLIAGMMMKTSLSV